MASSQQDRSGSFLHQTLSYAIQHPVQSVIVLLFAICAITRVVSGLRYRAAISRQSSGKGPQEVAVLPYWLPWLGHALNFAFGGSDFLTGAARSLGSNGSVYAIWMANNRHNVVTVPSVAKQVLVDRSSPITMEDFIYHVMKTFWGDGGSIKAVKPEALWGNIHGALTGMLREEFVSKAIKFNVDMVETRAWNLISGAASPVDQALWEREANVEILSSGKGDEPFIAEASLFPLLRFFVGDIATGALFGQDFMRNNPNILLDLFEMDTQFNLFLAGAPSWFPGMAGPVRARERIVEAIDQHHRALFKYLEGQDPGDQWQDMSDVSSVITNRAVEFRAAGSAPRGWATGNAAVLWAMNVNANPVIFWMIMYVFSDATLLQEIREEVAPYVRFSAPAATGLPIKEAPKLDIDIDSLWKKCALLKGAFFEAMRLEAASMSYKMIEQDFVVHEDERDARLLGKKEPQSWLLKKGELICIPHMVHQTDEKYFRDPERFDARRFWAADGHASEKGENGHANGHVAAEDVKVEYKTMKVWGGGKQMCKGKTFAEREVVLFAAAIIMQWDMTPVDNGGKWVHPGRKLGAGAVNPKKDMRVRMRRREGW
jgi:hypothetical protein